VEEGDSYISIIDMLKRLSKSNGYIITRNIYAMYKRDERLRHLYITATRFLADELHRRGVKKLYIGYPIMLSQNNGNEYNTNIWWFRKIVLWIVDIFMEYGIDVEIVPEEYASQVCLIAVQGIRIGEYVGGYTWVERIRKKINADINAAVNIARRPGHRLIVTRKIESYLVNA
jgi:putative transposase